MVRPATPDDVPALVTLGAQFHASTPYGALVPWNAAHVAAVTTALVAGERSTVLVAGRDGAPVGMLALALYPHPVSGEVVASELVWFVAPAHRGVGVRLLRAGEAWAQAQGATVMQMVAPSEDVGQMYARLGYTPVETAWQRRM